MRGGEEQPIPVPCDRALYSTLIVQTVRAKPYNICRLRSYREDAEEAMDGLEHLDWVRVGQLVVYHNPTLSISTAPTNGVKWTAAPRCRPPPVHA